MLLDLFTYEAGLIRGVWRKKQKETRVSPGSFLLHEFDIAGKSELKTVRSAEPMSHSVSLEGKALFCAFYVHELIERLAPLNLPLKDLFTLYQWLITHLSQGVPAAPLLRRFEVGLFDELGMAINLHSTARGEALLASQLYQFHSKVGLRPYWGEQPKVKPLVFLDGATAQGYEQGEWSNKTVLALAKELHRAWLDQALGGRELKSRSLLPTSEFSGERLWHVPVFRLSDR